MQRILIAGALPSGQAVFIADASHEVLEAGYPGASILPIGRDKVEGLDSFAVVNTEAAVWVETVVCVALEDLRLLALTHFMDRVNSYCEERQRERKK